MSRDQALVGIKHDNLGPIGEKTNDISHSSKDNYLNAKICITKSACEFHKTTKECWFNINDVEVGCELVLSGPRSLNGPRAMRRAGRLVGGGDGETVNALCVCFAPPGVQTFIRYRLRQLEKGLTRQCFPTCEVEGSCSLRQSKTVLFKLDADSRTLRRRRRIGRVDLRIGHVTAISPHPVVAFVEFSAGRFPGEHKSEICSRYASAIVRARWPTS